MSSAFSHPDAQRDELPRHASTVVLLREGENGLEVCLQRRHGRSQFMGGAYVFPGGKVDPEDSAPEMVTRLGPSATWCQERLEETPGRPLSEAEAVGLYVAAVRETFEEAGVLLARPTPVPCTTTASLRSALADKGSGFGGLMAGEALSPDVESLLYWAHWVTPSAERRRFDTRFFVARLPEGQTAVGDGTETTDLVWHTPSAALAAHDARTLWVPPPTQRTLQELEGLDDWAAIEAAARDRPIGAIMPKLIGTEGGFAILMPWDREFDSAEGDSLPGPPPPNPRPDLPHRIEVRR